MPGPERRLAAIRSADVVGYSHLMAEDEDAPIRAVTVCTDLRHAVRNASLRHDVFHPGGCS